MSKYTKARYPHGRLAQAMRLMRSGLPLEEAARASKIKPERLKRALGVDRKRLMEGETMDNEQIRQLAETLPRAAAHAGITLEELAQAAQLAVGMRTIHTTEMAGDERNDSGTSATVAEVAAEGQAETSGFDAAVDRRTEELAQRDRNAPYRQQALTEMIDRQGPQWEATGGVELNAMGQLRQERRDAGLSDDTDPTYTATAERIRQHAQEKGISENEAAAWLYDKGKIK